ncbi:hypothetical protein Ami103574_07630 [Aminipila butyrica]|uniref:Uncharacterized protein n=1 Tax=Aminipila butyrica TaxID=433296 RepID=A0A858BWC0_9FIRM|nr:hypothetical protein [Aminipila butyrica]QIB69200.1 hypothetical protein Ami103574_07630 [Aminipila butyrica]
MKIASISIVMLLLFMIGAVLLQVFLSSRENKWLGWVLPGISFSYSLLILCYISVLDSMGPWQVVAMLASTFFIANIPTIIFLVIYFTMRRRFKKNREMEKMQIQDL